MRVETIGNATLYCGDCLAVREQLVGDALIADPPYGINLHALCGTGRENVVVRDQPLDVRIVGDDQPFDPAPWLNYPKVILWGGIHFAARLPDSRAWFVWDKRKHTASDNQADCEIAWSNLPGPARIYRQLWRGYAREGEENLSNGPKLHPAQKPVALMSWCIERCGLAQGATVVDPYMGSGSTGVSAVRMGMRFIGCEIEERHFEVACERIAGAQLQKRLFA